MFILRPSTPLEGYPGAFELVFDGFRRAFVRTTFPVYLEELPRASRRTPP
ncbi:hypothetical protein [Acidilobus sp.]